MKRSFGFVGGGRITRIILNGFRNAGKLPEKIIVSDADEDVLDRLKRDFPGITTVEADNSSPASCDLVFISLHPPAIVEALLKIKSLIRQDAVVVSLAPKISLSRLTAILDRHAKIVRMIPNAPSLMNRGYNPVAFSRAISPEEKAELIKQFETLGECPEVPEEHLEAYAILAAMGPTYFWFQWQVLSEIGQSFGLTGAAAQEAISRMIQGAAHTMFDACLKPEEVVDLIPVKPLAGDEETIRDIYSSRLNGLYAKLKGLA